MVDLCNCDQTVNLKVEADIGADAIWCAKCYANIDIDLVPLSIELKSELAKWIFQYGEWIDWNTDGIVQNGVELEVKHNKQGLRLTEKVRKELTGKYEVSFSPSTFAKRQSNKEFND